MATVNSGLHVCLRRNIKRSKEFYWFVFVFIYYLLTTRNKIVHCVLGINQTKQLYIVPQFLRCLISFLLFFFLDLIFPFFWARITSFFPIISHLLYYERPSFTFGKEGFTFGRL